MSSTKAKPALEKIVDSARDVQQKVLKGQKPEMATPVRSLANVKYLAKRGHFEMLGKNKKRTLTVSTVKTFAQTLKMMALAKELIVANDMATKREAYYISKNWGKAGFDEQPESDTIMDDIEAMFGVNREQLKFIPEEKGGDLAGRLIVIDKDAKGARIKIDCTKFGSGAYSIPTDVEGLEFQGKADFILAIETAGMFQRLVKYDYWDKANCILVSMGGVPTRACRRFIRRLADKMRIPVYAFVDGDPYGYFNIYRTLKAGSGNAAHLNQFFCAPVASFLGVTPQDVIDYKLPTHPLKDVDIKRAKDALRNDPFVKHHAEWQAAINQMLKMGVRVEQQAFAKHGLDFVVNEYLPAKLRNTGKFLP
ncbi:MAG TPA: DNA topoisomerase IV subunit A [Sedimentisphaerales bacterium]|nr:DNA topoisomerase IV subunit A [Sedimentisphaerales bacterium]